MMEKLVEFYKAYDLRDPDPKKDRGVHGVSLVFVLKGELGAVDFIVYTNWTLDLADKMCTYPIHEIDMPMAADLGHHGPNATYEGQSVANDSCKYLDGKPCYYDGSTLNAEPVFRTLLREGSDGVWKELEEYYVSTFGELR